MSNPGFMLVSLSQYYEGGISECRNPSLQKMFGLIGKSDKAGSGVDKILKGWRSAKWRRPYIILIMIFNLVQMYQVRMYHVRMYQVQMNQVRMYHVL